MESDKPEFAIVELMGHVRIAGRLSEVERYGGHLGRLDIPDGNGGYSTQLFGAASVYRITIVTEQVATLVALANKPSPVSPWDLPRIEAKPRVPPPIEEDPADDYYSDVIDDEPAVDVAPAETPVVRQEVGPFREADNTEVPF